MGRGSNTNIAMIHQVMVGKMPVTGMRFYLEGMKGNRYIKLHRKATNEFSQAML